MLYKSVIWICNILHGRLLEPDTTVYQKREEAHLQFVF